jgi:alpha-L-fucosidase
VLGEFVSARAWGVNYLLGVGPTSDGVFPQAVYDNMKVVGGWMRKNAPSVQHVQQLPSDEAASVPATSKDNYRFLFAIPQFKNSSKYDKDRLPSKDETISLKTSFQPKSVSVLASGKKLNFKYNDGQVIIDLPANVRTNLVDVIQVELKK